MHAPLRKSPGRTRPGGFTLIELMVGLAVMALLALMSWQGIDAMTRVQTQNRERGDAVITLQTALAQWGADLDATVAMPQLQALDWNGSLLRLTRQGADGTRPVLHVVAWAMSADGATGMRWRRWQSGPITSRSEWQLAWDQATTWGRGNIENLRGAEVTLMPIDTWHLYFFRGGAWTDSAVDANSLGGFGSTLPDGIRLMLSLPPGAGLSGTLTRDWLRPTAAVPKS